MKNWIANILYHRLGADYGGTPSPPGSDARLSWKSRGDREKVASFRHDDGFSLHLGYMDAWQFDMQSKDAPRLAWFILWHWWIRGTWCGLRRKLWFWALHRRCEAAVGGHPVCLDRPGESA